MRVKNKIDRYIDRERELERVTGWGGEGRLG